MGGLVQKVRWGCRWKSFRPDIEGALGVCLYACERLCRTLCHRLSLFTFYFSLPLPIRDQPNMKGSLATLEWLSLGRDSALRVRDIHL